MSKEEILKIQVCVLKVNIHCDGCKDKVKKILQKIDGVFTTKIDAEAGKVTVSGNVDPSLLIKKLGKAGKRAELWGSRKPNGNNNNNIHNQMPNQFKNMNVNAKGGNDKGQKPNGNNNVNQVKGGNNPQQNQLQMKLQQIKELQSMMPQLKDQKMGPGHPNQKAVKFVDEDDDEYSDDEYDGEYSDEFDEDDDEFDDEDYEIDQPHHPTNKMIMNALNPQFMNNAQKGAANGKQGVPGGGGKNGNGGQKGGGGGGNFNGNGGGKNNGGKPQNGQNGGGGNKTVGGGGGGKDNNIPILMNGVQKGNNGGGAMNGGLGNMVGPGGAGQFGNMKIPVGQINNMSMSQLSNIPAVQGLPAASSGGPSGGNGYYPGSGPDMMAGNPINQQQQYLAMMNQQRAMGGNERFQPMMYARPPPAVNYVPPPYPYPYPSPYPPHYGYGYGSDPYSDAFSDENTSSSCNIM